MCNAMVGFTLFAYAVGIGMGFLGGWIIWEN